MSIDIHKEHYTFDDLNKIMEVLLSENGCPWDKAQTHESIMPSLLEECYEVIDAIQSQDKNSLCEELGDVLFQVVFNAKLEEKDGGFTIDTVIDGIAKKLISRHTHIFGAAQAGSMEDVINLWEKNKKTEKGYTSIKEDMLRVPKAFPALFRAEKVLKKSEKTDDNTPNMNDPIDEAIQLLNSLKHMDSSHTEANTELIGSILMKIVQTSRKLQINAEFSLTNAVETYINKFV